MRRSSSGNTRATRNVTDVWALGAWSGEYGYPGEVEFFSDRLVFAGGTPTRSLQTLWMSGTGNYTSFRQVAADRGHGLDQRHDQRAAGQRDPRPVPLDSLVILTTGGEWKTTGGRMTLTPTTVGFAAT